jgi:hypothetical protein
LIPPKKKVFTFTFWRDDNKENIFWDYTSFKKP